MTRREAVLLALLALLALLQPLGEACIAALRKLPPAVADLASDLTARQQREVAAAAGGGGGGVDIQAELEALIGGLDQLRLGPAEHHAALRLSQRPQLVAVARAVLDGAGGDFAGAMLRASLERSGAAEDCLSSSPEGRARAQYPELLEAHRCLHRHLHPAGGPVWARTAGFRWLTYAHRRELRGQSHIWCGV